jgi:hypothetical protein
MTRTPRQPAITASQIRKMVRQVPNAHLQYWDDRSWVICKRKPSPSESTDTDALEELELIQGTDHEDCVGYMPRLTEALANLCGITAESI